MKRRSKSPALQFNVVALLLLTLSCSLAVGWWRERNQLVGRISDLYRVQQELEDKNDAQRAELTQTWRRIQTLTEYLSQTEEWIKEHCEGSPEFELKFTSL